MTVIEAIVIQRTLGEILRHKVGGEIRPYGVFMSSPDFHLSHPSPVASEWRASDVLLTAGTSSAGEKLCYDGWIRNRICCNTSFLRR